jgi:type I restriction enzyme R subunit
VQSLGLIVDYVGIFDNVARALDFDEKIVQTVIANIDEVKEQFPVLIEKCLSYFSNVNRTIEGFEGLLLAQECLINTEIKDKFGADFAVCHRAYEILSPDGFLQSYRHDYIWLAKVFDSLRPVDGRGGLVWMTLGQKTLDLVQQNISVVGIRDDIETLVLDADIIDQFFEQNKNKPEKKVKEIEIKLTATLRKHKNDSRFIKLGERLENLRETRTRFDNEYRVSKTSFRARKRYGTSRERNSS